MRVLIADDHDLLRDTLVEYLQSQGGFEVDCAGDLDTALALVESSARFDLILLDLKMPGMDGLNGLTRMLGARGGQRVALMSGSCTRETAERAIELGAAGVVPKTMSAKSMVNAVKFMALGEIYAPVEFLNAMDSAATHPLTRNLTKREQQVLRGLTEGKANKEIARDLDVQEPTVKLHMKTLYRKLGVANRTQAALIAREAGLY